MMGTDQSIDDANKSPLLSGRDEGVRFEHSSRPASAGNFSDVKGIYLDLDDTLCTYWDASKSGLRRAFSLHGPAGYTPEECVRAWAKAFRSFAPTLKQTGWYAGYLKEGEPTRTEQMRRTLRELEIEDEAMAVRLSECYLHERDSSLRLFEDAIEVLESLKARFPLGLITNGPADIQRMEIATLGIEHYFDHVLIEGEMGEGKPKLAVFQRASDLMGLKPTQMLMVGNSFRHDVQAAIEAGWKAIWIRRPSDVPPSAGPEDVEPEEMPVGGPEPDAVLNDLRSLLPLLPAHES